MSLDLDAVRADLTELHDDQYPGQPSDLCPSWLYTGIRHLVRNCDIECSEHGDDDSIDACVTPGRWGGDAMARLLNAVPDLVARIEELERTVENLRDSL